MCNSSIISHQSNGQLEGCIKLVKWTRNKCFDIKSDKHLALLQVRTMLLGPGIPSPATLLLYHPTRGIMPLINSPPIRANNDDEHHKVKTKKK